MSEGLVHIATYDGLVHTPDNITAGPPGYVDAQPPGRFEAQPPGSLIVPTPPPDQAVHILNEGVIGHLVNELI